MKKALEIIKNILVGIITAVAMFMMIFTIVSVSTFDRNDRSIFGYKAFIVLSDSMSASNINAGDIVLVRAVDPTTLKVGDIISYTSQATDNFGEVVTHMIRSVTTDAEGNPGFVTYGTTTGADDPNIVTYPYINGKLQASVPKVGTFFRFLKTPQGYIVCIFIPFLLLILYQGLNCIKLFKRYKKEQMEEIQAERKQIESERKMSEDMMREIQALKEQLAATQRAQNPAEEQPAAVSADTETEEN